MPAPVKVIFVTAGAKEVEAVFGSLTRKMQAFGRAQATSAARASQAATTATTTGEKQIDRIRAQTATMAGQHAKRAASAEAAAAKQSAKVVAAEARRVDRIRERSAIMAGRHAVKAAAAEAAAAKQSAKARVAAERVANAEVIKLGRRGANLGMTGMRNAYGSVRGAVGMVGAGVGVAAIGGGVHSAYMLNRRGALLSNVTQMPGATSRSGSDLVEMARAPAAATGVAAEDVMSMMELIGARAGGAAGIEKLKGDLLALTKAAVATGTSMEDMGGVVAAAFNAGVEPGEDLLSLVRTMTAQTKAGQIEMADFASELSRLGGVGMKWGTGANMLADVGGLAQIAAITTGGSPQQSRTAVVAMMRELSQAPKIKALSGMGVETSGEDGYMRHPFAVMADAIDAVETGAEPESMRSRLKGLTGDERQRGIYSSLFMGESAGLVQTLRQTYMQGYEGQYGERKGKKYTGADAVRARLEESARPYKQTKEQAEEEYQNVAKTMELARAHEEFKAKMADVLPELAKLIPTLIQVASGFARMVVWIGKNPFHGLGAFIMAMMGKELAAAAIGKTVEAAFAKFGEALSGGGSNLGKAAAIGSIFLTATAVYLTGTRIIDEALGSFEEKQNKLVGSTDDARRVIANPNATPAEMKAALDTLKADQASAKAEGVGMITGWAGSVGAVLAGDESLDPSTRASTNDIEAAKLAAQLAASITAQETLARTNEAVAKALGENTAALGGGGGGLANPNAGPRTTPASRAGVK